VYAPIKNNEAVIIVAQAILPMLFVSIGRKCLRSEIPAFDRFQNCRSEPIPLLSMARINRAEVSFPELCCL
jgi:hypothetical protein